MEDSGRTGPSDLEGALRRMAENSIKQAVECETIARNMLERAQQERQKALALIQNLDEQFSSERSER